MNGWRSCLPFVKRASLQPPQFSVFTRSDGYNLVFDLARVTLDSWPTGGWDDENRAASASQVLLVPHVPIRSDQQLESALSRLQ